MSRDADAMGESFTVFGGYGFVGGAVASLLEQQGHRVERIGRHNWPPKGADLGHAIFTVGMTADFRTRLMETFELQLLRLHDALTWYTHASFLYLSSARVYAGSSETSEEAHLLVRPADHDHVYNLSKLAGESLCFASANPAVRVARLSNVFGTGDTSNLFLTAVMREAVATGSVSIGQAPDSSKDYVPVEHVAAALVKIARHGRHRLYNVASGRNVSHREIADLLASAGYSVRFKEGGAPARFPPIDIGRVTQEFGVSPGDPRAHMSRVLRELQARGAAPW